MCNAQRPQGNLRMFMLCHQDMFKSFAHVHITNAALVQVLVASSPGPSLRGRKGLVHTDCLHMRQIISKFSVKLPVYYSLLRDLLTSSFNELLGRRL